MRVQDAKRGLGTSAVFIARNRFAVLDKSTNSIQIRNLQNEITKKVSRAWRVGAGPAGALARMGRFTSRLRRVSATDALPCLSLPDLQVPTPCATTDAIFYAGTGMLLCRSEDKVRPAFRVLACLDQACHAATVLIRNSLQN